jgi:hypothetical protein
MSIKVNVSEQEDRAGAREPLPVGKYHYAITSAELSESQSDNNYGKPMMVFELTVQDTPGPWQQFAGRKDFANAMLWEGALYTIIMMLKAIGEYEDCKGPNGELDIPTEAEFWEGRELIGRRGVDPKQKKAWPDMPERWVQLRSYMPYDEDSAAEASKDVRAPADASLLP